MKCYKIRVSNCGSLHKYDLTCAVQTCLVKSTTNQFQYKVARRSETVAIAEFAACIKKICKYITYNAKYIEHVVWRQHYIFQNKYTHLPLNMCTYLWSLTWSSCMAPQNGRTAMKRDAIARAFLTRRLFFLSFLKLFTAWRCITNIQNYKIFCCIFRFLSGTSFSCRTIESEN